MTVRTPAGMLSLSAGSRESREGVDYLYGCAGRTAEETRHHILLNQVKNYLASSIPQEIKDAGNDLNQYATATRYPAEEEITQAEADQAIEEATAILQWVERESEAM